MTSPIREESKTELTTTSTQPAIASYIESYEADKTKDDVVLHKVAQSVAWAETHDCTLGYGEMYNNCFGIKNGNTAPCPKVGKNRMCIYERPEDSYVAFKKIWSKWYGGGLPSYSAAARWTGNDRPDSWLKNVHSKYNSL